MAIQQKAKTSTTCSRCQNPAISHCSSCEIFLCKKCSEWHDSWSLLKNHHVLSVQELSNPKSQVKLRRKLYCAKHEDKILEYYCETCKELCCIDCVVLIHTKPNHSCVAMREIKQKQREALQSSCTTLDEKLAEGKKALNNICEVMKSLEKNAKTAKDQIKKQKENILNIVGEKLDERAKIMNEEVDKVYGELHSKLSKQHDEMKDYLDKVQASVSLPKNLVKRGSIEEIMSSQKLIDEKIEKLSNQQPENLAAVNDGSIQYVQDDVGNINVDEIVDKLGHVEGGVSVTHNLLKKSSSILKGEIAFMKQLQKWLGEKCKWNLCYRASRDGWSAQDFHKHCDNKGPTVVLVKASDCIFGGYTDQHWASPGGVYKHSNASFLFSLRNKDNLAPFIANIKQGQEQYAILCNFGYGPIFGSGNDLVICNNPEVNRSYSNFGSSYQLPPGYINNSEQAKNLLAGQYYFVTTEIEVFN
ncbi:basement membrane-specific heparan sulfate proteoglycan core -like [Paramuricea clavata]|nr:basement membrane-specific heparan sulfate proteoglycan core -like [Paramuricea clavata]